MRMLIAERRRQSGEGTCVSRSRCRGATFVELVIALPVFIFFIFGMIDFCGHVVSANMLNYALQAGGRRISMQHANCAEVAEEFFSEIRKDSFGSRHLTKSSYSIRDGGPGLGKIVTLKTSIRVPCFVMCPLMQMGFGEVSSEPGMIDREVDVRLEDPHAAC